MRMLSHSQFSKYLQCPRSYKLHYIEKLREKSATAFLAFGSAMDIALNSILNDIKEGRELNSNYKEYFDNQWTEIVINKKSYDLIDCPLVGYAKADLVLELLTESDRIIIKKFAHSLCPEFENDSVEQIANFLLARKDNPSLAMFNENEKRLLNVINWHCMRRKAHLMLDAYVKNIVPEIEEVKEIQKKINLESQNGNSLVGYVDAIVKFKGDKEYSILDNKTSASPYSLNKVKTSEQLCLYTFAAGLKKAAFAVMIKAIKLNKEKTCIKCGYVTDSSHKTCNNEIDGQRCKGEWNIITTASCDTQLIKDTISEINQEVVINNIGEVTDAINANIFPKNLSTCANIYGNPCPYMAYCWSNEQKMDNLEKVE